jgi:hypothetical protein
VARRMVKEKGLETVVQWVTIVVNLFGDLVSHCEVYEV